MCMCLCRICIILLTSERWTHWSWSTDDPWLHAVVYSRFIVSDIQTFHQIFHAISTKFIKYYDVGHSISIGVGFNFWLNFIFGIMFWVGCLRHKATCPTTITKMTEFTFQWTPCFIIGCGVCSCHLWMHSTEGHITESHISMVISFLTIVWQEIVSHFYDCDSNSHSPLK